MQSFEIKEKKFRLSFYSSLKAKKISTREKRVLKAFTKVMGEFLEKKNKKALGLSAELYQVNITLCGKNKILSLNKNYRKKNKTTDVLSFPVHENLRNIKKGHLGVPVVELGDIFICHEVTKKQAKDFKISYENELIHLALHGFLHLCGFDHEISSKEEKIMQELEKFWIEKIHKKIG